MYPSRRVQNNAPAADSAYWSVLWAGRGWTLIFFFPGGGLRVIKSVGAHLSLNYWENILKWNSFCIVKDGKSNEAGHGFGRQSVKVKVEGLEGGGAKLVSRFRFSWTYACCLHWLHWRFGIMTNSPKVDCVSRILKPLIHPESFVGESSWTCLCVSGCFLCPATDWLM